MNDSEFSWTDEPVIGIVLANAERDSYGNEIDPMKYYNVAKVVESGMIVIVEAGGNMRDDFINMVWKQKCKLN